MIYYPKKSNPVVLKNIDQWNVFDWDLVHYLDKDSINNCYLNNLGLTKSVKLQNLNGKYSLMEQTYNSAPIYQNSEQQVLVTGPGYTLGKSLDTLDHDEVSDILNNNTYSIYRDGPYFLGKFGPDNTWAIIKLPSLFDQNRFIDTSTIDFSSFSSLDIKDSIIIHQIIGKPPRRLKNETRSPFNSQLGSRAYSNWKNNVDPLARDWTINKSKIPANKCNNQYNFIQLSNNHFSTEISSKYKGTKKIFQPKIPSSVPFRDKVYNEFILLKNYFINHKFTDKIIFPPIMYSMPCYLTLGENNDYENGVIDNLGYTLLDNKMIIKLNINGKFIHNTSTIDILYAGQYSVSGISVTLENGSEKTFLVREFKDSLHPITTNIIRWIENELSSWCKTTAFLYPPKVCTKDWLDLARSVEINLLTDGLPKYQSKFSSKISFINMIESTYYDRLYEYMKFKGEV